MMNPAAMGMNPAMNPALAAMTPQQRMNFLGGGCPGNAGAAAPAPAPAPVVTVVPNQVKISNLIPAITKEQLLEIFGNFGTVLDCKITGA